MSQSFAHGRVLFFPWQSLNKERSPALPLILPLFRNSDLLIVLPSAHAPGSLRELSRPIRDQCYNPWGKATGWRVAGSIFQVLKSDNDSLYWHPSVDFDYGVAP